jgi:beta-glucosidase
MRVPNGIPLAREFTLFNCCCCKSCRNTEGAGFVNRHAFNALVSEQDLSETYLPAFDRTVAAGAAGVMCSYNARGWFCADVSDFLRVKRFGWLE